MAADHDAKTKIIARNGFGCAVDAQFQVNGVAQMQRNVRLGEFEIVLPVGHGRQRLDFQFS
jgi:hypothetical protein